MSVGCMLDLRPNLVEPYYDFRTLLLLGFPFMLLKELEIKLSGGRRCDQAKTSMTRH